MKKLYELSKGDTFYYSGVYWRVKSFKANHRYCTPVSEPGSESHIAFHIDTEVQVFEW
jgi:Lhr-like helicase